MNPLDPILLPNSPVRNVMNTQVVTIHPGAPLLAAEQKMTRHELRALPVVEEGVLVGVITADDLQRCINIETDIVADYMSMPAITCHEDDTIESVRELLLQRGIGQAVVQGAVGEIVGIVNWQDLEGAAERKVA